MVSIRGLLGIEQEIKKPVALLKKPAVAPIPAVETTFPNPVSFEAPSREVEIMTSKIEYLRGISKESKAGYFFGKAHVPAIVISKIIGDVKIAVKHISDESSINRIKSDFIHERLMDKYSAFLDALDKAEIDYGTAYEQMKEIKPEIVERAKAEKKSPEDKERNKQIKILAGILASISPNTTPAELFKMFMSGVEKYGPAAVEYLTNMTGRDKKGYILLRVNKPK